MRALCGSHYNMCFLCQSYGEQFHQEGAPGYGEDASGPLELFMRCSTMPTDQYQRYNLTNNHYDREGRQTLTINNWHTAQGEDWVDKGYFDASGSVVYGGWHLPFDPSWMGVFGGQTGYGAPVASQALQAQPMQMDMLNMTPIVQALNQQTESEQPRGGFYFNCMRLLGANRARPSGIGPIPSAPLLGPTDKP